MSDHKNHPIENVNSQYSILNGCN